ncbi:beta-N-acetylhexosaminidase [Clostridium sp. CAG:492]|nr:beta-N-acetylhexosaminidase [Clostridium sp. CAG:492]
MNDNNEEDDDDVVVNDEAVDTTDGEADNNDEGLQSQSDVQDDMQNIANSINLKKRKNKDKASGKRLLAAGKALYHTGDVLVKVGEDTQRVGNEIKNLGEKLKEKGKKEVKDATEDFKTGLKLCKTGVGALVGVPLCLRSILKMIKGGATILGGSILKVIGSLINFMGKALAAVGKAMRAIGQKMMEIANKKIAEAGGNISNLSMPGGKNDKDDVEVNSIPGVGGLSETKLSKTKKIIIMIAIGAAIVIAFVWILMQDWESTKENGSEVTGDLKNVPYTVSSKIMDNLVIATDESGAYTYGFKNDDGEIVDIDQAIDSAIKSLEENKSKSLYYLGKNTDNRKALLKKMILAEIATQYPDLSDSVDLGLSGTSTSGTSSSVNSSNDTNSNSSSSSTNVDEIIKNMTIEEKIYQMIMMQAIVSDGSNYADTSVGGVIVATNSNYDANLANIGSKYKITPFVATDDEGGNVERAATGYKTAREYGDSEDYDELYNSEVKKCKELLSKGINLNLGPVSDVISSGALYDRSYGSDSAKVEKCIETILKARASVNVSGNSVGSTLKHYPGYPDNNTNTDTGIAKDNRSIDKINDNINVFKQGVNNGANAIMVSNVIYTNLDANNPASLSPTIISGLRSSFSGVIMTDDIGSAAGVSSISDRYKKAILAGNDMILVWDSNLNDAYSQIKAAVDSGEITEERINESVTRILNWKLNGGTLSGNNSSSSNKNSVKATAGTGDAKTSEKFNSSSKINGGIKVQRKLESGSVINLKYTSTENFNALMASNSDDIINYYTLQKKASSSSSKSIEGDFSGSNNAEIIWNFLTSKGLSETCTAAILGNLYKESGLNPGVEENTPALDKGYGLAQWTFERRTQIETYAQAMNKPVSDIELQLQFLWLEIDSDADHTYANLQWGGRDGWQDTNGLYQRFINMTDIDEATAFFCWNHERPNEEYAHLEGEDGRKAWAKKFYDLYAGKKSSSSSSTTSSSKKNEDSSDNEKSNENSSATEQSFDNYLFIGDSRYEGISSELSALGSNVTVCAATSSAPSEWIDIAKNGSGTVKGKSQTLPSTVKNVSIMLGVNNLSETAEMEYLMNALHEKYSSATIYANSVFHVGSAYSGAASNEAIDKYNDEIRNFCNQNSSWAKYIDVTNGLNDESGYLKSEYATSDGLHIGSTEGKTTLVNNIETAITGASSTGSTTTSDVAASSLPGYTIVVANRTSTITNVVESYQYTGTSYTDIGHSSYIDNGKRWSNPSSGPKSNRTTAVYSPTAVAYQEALKNYTLYFNFLWAVLVDTENINLVGEWADLVCDNVGKNSKVVVTVYSDVETTTTQTENSRVQSFISNENGIVIDDTYNVTEIIYSTISKMKSKLAVTYADTWLMKYENNAETYDEYTSKSKESITEKVDIDDENETKSTDTNDDKEKNAIEILKENDVSLRTMKKEKKIIKEMLSSSEKVSFMVDILDYILDKASGNDTEENALSKLLDVSSFNLNTFTPTSGTSSNGEALAGGSIESVNGGGYRTKFTTGGRTFVEYKQGWGNTAPWGNVYVNGWSSGSNMGNSGCALTSIAVIATGYGVNISPQDVADLVNSGEYNWGDLLGITKHYIGKSCEWQTTGDIQHAIINQLKAGKPCMVHTTVNYPDGHFLTVLAYNEETQEVYVSNVGGWYDDDPTRNGWQPVEKLSEYDECMLIGD